MAGAVAGANLELALFAAPARLAHALAVEALAARWRVRRAASMQAAGNVARRAVPPRSAEAGAIEAASAMETVASGTRRLITRRAVPASITLAIVYRSARAMPRATARTDPLRAVGAAPAL